MKKILLAVVPLVLAAITIILLKPSDEKCKQVAIEKLATINVKASPGDILIDDYFFMKLLRFAHTKDTFRLGSAAFLQVRVKDEKLEKIKAGVK